MPEDLTTRDLLLAELRVALLRAKSAQAEIEFIGKALGNGTFGTQESLEALEDLCLMGFLQARVVEKIRKACGADVG